MRFLRLRASTALTRLLVVATIAGCSGEPAGLGPVPIQQARFEITPGEGSLEALDETTQLGIFATDGTGQPSRITGVSWSTDNSSIVTVSADGLVTATGNGTVKVRAHRAGRTATASFQVEQVPVLLIVRPRQDTLSAIGEELQIRVTSYDANGNPLRDGAIDFESADPSIADVDGNGLVVAKQEGLARIHARGLDTRKLKRRLGKQDTAVVVVRRKNNYLSMVPRRDTLDAIGLSLQMKATYVDGTGQIVPRTDLTWSSKHPGTASVDQNGLVTGQALGNAIIVVKTSDNLKAESRITVRQVPHTVNVTPATLSLASVGQTGQLSAVAVDKMGNQMPWITLAWSSSDPSVATVSGGLVSAIATGSATITASVNGGAIRGTASIVVAVPPPPPAPPAPPPPPPSDSTTTPPPPPASGVDSVWIETTWADSVLVGVTFADVFAVDSFRVCWRDGAGLGLGCSHTRVVESDAPFYAAWPRGSADDVRAAELSGMPTPPEDHPLGSVTVSARAGSPPPPPPPPPPGGGGVAVLPQSTIRWAVPAPARIVTVAAGDNLQTAINQAQPGDELRLDPAGVWGPINLPNRSWNGSWIRVTCDGCQLPVYGSRVTAAQVAGMPTVRSGSFDQALDGRNGTSGWWFTGIHFEQPAQSFTYEMLAFIGSDHLSFDRIGVTGNNETYNSGQPSRGTRRCILGNATWIQVIGSRLSQCNVRWADAQAYVQWEGGPTRLHNNFLSGSGEIVMIGGADPKSDAAITKDIEITNNNFWWDQKYKLTGGNVFAFKNHLEFKTGRRALVEGNTFENHWTGVSSQYNAIVIKGLDQSGDTNPNCPWCLTEDITFRGNTILNAAAGIHLCPSCEGVGHVLRRVTIDGNSIQIVASQSSNSIRREAIALTGKTQYGSGFTITNNTVTGANRWMLADHGGEPHGGVLAVCGWEQTGNSSSMNTFVGRNALPPDHFLNRTGCTYSYQAP